MADDTLHQVNDVLAEISKNALRTSAGTFYREEDVRRLIEKRTEARAIEAKEPGEPPKTLVAARKAAGAFLKDALGPQAPREPGRSIPSNEPQPPREA